MKFGLGELGVIIPGSTLYSPLHQGFEIVKFAMSQGFEYDAKSLQKDIEDSDNWSYDDYEEFDYLVTDAVDYLNVYCAEDGFGFVFRDTDFVLEDLTVEYD